MLNILSVDLEDWFHILDHKATARPDQWEKFEPRIERNTERLLNLFEEKGQKATWFCLGWMARKHPQLIKKISTVHHIACHSDLHELVYLQDARRFKEDTIRAKIELEDLIGKEVDVYRAPGFSVTKETAWFYEVLLECGFKTDSSIFPTKRSHGGFSDFGTSEPCRIQSQGRILKEFPMNTRRVLGKEIVFSGGGYFRALPYSFIHDSFLKAGYVMCYFHPRDFDPEQKVISSLPWKRKFMSYIGLKSSEKKLRRLLEDHNFVDIPTAEANINWEQTPLILI
ncbi:MAG TPA: polysaccharide deacetylase family protein [Bacteroidia bacterium]|nr:polysaccharide deacetylase family protein [Bacteroidia bacterium]